MRKFQVVATTLVAVAFTAVAVFKFKENKEILGLVEQEKVQLSELSNTRVTLTQELEGGKTQGFNSLTQTLEKLTEGKELELVQYTPYAFDVETESCVEVVSVATKIEECAGYEHLVDQCEATLVCKSVEDALKKVQSLELPIVSFSLNKEEKSLQLRFRVDKSKSSKVELD